MNEINTRHKIEASSAIDDAIKAGVDPKNLFCYHIIANRIARECGFKTTEDVWCAAHKFGRIEDKK